MKCGRKYDAVHTWILGFHMFCCEAEMWTGRIPFRELKFFNVIIGGDGLRNVRFSIVRGDTRPLNGTASLYTPFQQKKLKKAFRIQVPLEL